MLEVEGEPLFHSRIDKRTEAVRESSWLQAETLQYVRLHRAHFLALIGGELSAPHVPAGDLPQSKAKPPKWPLPTELVSENTFERDEWVYDPAIHGRIVATDLDKDAVRCANHLIAGHGDAFLVLTDRRLAVVIEEQDIAGESGVSRLLGRFAKGKDTDTDKDKDAGNGAEPPEHRLTTWWETGRPPVRDLFYGRHFGNAQWFNCFTFTDGSTLEIRRPD